MHFILGLFLCSCLFSSEGLVIAAKSIRLSGFIISTIPAQLIINFPAVAWLFGWRPGWILLHSGVSMMELFENGKHVLPAFIIIAFPRNRVEGMAMAKMTSLFLGLAVPFFVWPDAQYLAFFLPFFLDGKALQGREQLIFDSSSGGFHCLDMDAGMQVW